jgi:excisionase family DNA binding protein
MLIMSQPIASVVWLGFNRERVLVMVSDEVPSRFEQLWDVSQAAEYMKVSENTLYGWRCRKYGPPSYRLGNKIRYRPEEVRDWVTAQEVRAWVDEQTAWAS